MNESTNTPRGTAAPGRLRAISDLGQSIWLDYIRRDLITSGDLGRMIEADGLKGMTSNPAIFAQAIGDSDIYDGDIRAMALEGRSTRAIYEALSQRDVRDAADLFRPVYEATDGLDGYVSLEVNPHLARDTRGTIIEGRRLWAALDRPNVLIKVPATREGLPAIQRLLHEGINVNVTLLFGVPRYREVAKGYLAALGARLAEGKDVHRVASVASFFVSRIDALVDPMLEAVIAQGGPEAETARNLLGQVAIASSKRAWQACQDLFSTAQGKGLLAARGRVQRLLWASTGTKNPAYADLKYVEALIGADTVDTVPMATLDAYRDHGDPQARLTEDLPEAATVADRLARAGIHLDAVTQQLEDEGVEKFKKPFDHLMETLALRSTRHSREDRP